VSIFSYCGQVAFGVTGDRDGAADVATVADGLADGLAELVRAAERAHV
jgi:diacylglycerol O-acyltransferase